MSPTLGARADRGCRDCGKLTQHADYCRFMEPKSATREVQDWQRHSGEKVPRPDGWAQRSEYKP